MEATSCGGVVIFRGKVLVLYKCIKNKYEGWVLPKGTVEEGEDHMTCALREVREESGVNASAIKYIGKSQYSFNTTDDIINKHVVAYEYVILCRINLSECTLQAIVEFSTSCIFFANLC